MRGEAAGFCGALEGDRTTLGSYHKEVQKYGKLMTYYRKQVLYRFIWDHMKSDCSFHAMFDVIAREKENFIKQFCDSKDKNKSLVSVVLKWRNLPHLIKYGFSLVLDFFHL